MDGNTDVIGVKSVGVKSVGLEVNEGLGLEGEGEEGVIPSYGLLIADPSFDVWSLG